MMYLRLLFIYLFILKNCDYQPKTFATCVDSIVPTEHFASKSFFYNRNVNRNEVVYDGIRISADTVVDRQAFTKVISLINAIPKDPNKILFLLNRLRIRILIIGKYQNMTDLPEYRHLRLDPSMNWDIRAKGLGPTRTLPIVSIGEENLLKLSFDRYKREDIFIHEFSHAIFLSISDYCPQFKTEVDNAYKHALDNGLWQNTYAGSNVEEYFAETSMSWFDANRKSVFPDGIKNDINTREKLQQYDPTIYEILKKIYAPNSLPHD